MTISTYWVPQVRELLKNKLSVVAIAHSMGIRVIDVESVILQLDHK